MPLALRRDLDRKVAVFLKDTEDKQNPLAGWARFRTMAGTEHPRRELFAAMYRAEGTLLEAVEKDPKTAGSQIVARARTLEEAFRQFDQDYPPLAEVVVVLFVAADERVPLDGPAFTTICTALNGLRYKPKLTKELQESVPGRALLIAFLRRPGDAAARTAAFDLARTLEIKEAVKDAVAAALAKDLASTTRAAALMLLSKLGSKELIPHLEPLLDDATQVGSVVIRRVRLTTQISDVALAALIQLSGQDESEYGFPYLEVVPGLKNLPSVNRLGFADPAGRQAALKKWKTWSAAHRVSKGLGPEKP